MTKEKKTTSTKKTSKAKLVKVEEKPFDLIIDFGPAHENEDRKEIELAAAKLVEDKQAEDKASILSSDTVKEFLTQYYTKEKLAIQISVRNPKVVTTLFSTTNPENVKKNIAFIEEPVDWELVREVQDIIGDQKRVSWANS